MPAVQKAIEEVAERGLLLPSDFQRLGAFSPAEMLWLSDWKWGIPLIERERRVLPMNFSNSGFSAGREPATMHVTGSDLYHDIKSSVSH